MQDVIKRFSKEFKKPRRRMMNQLYDRVRNKTYPAKASDRPFTIHILYHWLYNHSVNETLDKYFLELLLEEDPKSLEGDNVFERE